jgi:hypothetical protein
MKWRSLKEIAQEIAEEKKQVKEKKDISEIVANSL